MNKKAVKKQAIPYLILGLFIIGVLFFMNMANNTIEILSYNEFASQIKDVKTVTITPSIKGGVYEITGQMKNYDKNKYFYIKTPLSEEVVSQVLTASVENNFTVITFEMNIIVITRCISV